MPTSNSLPLVSILVAYYNNLPHIEEAIKSAVNQTYKNIEIIVVDDCSPDEEARILIDSLSKVYGFKLIRSEKNKGASASFQIALENSSGEYISILSHDDLYQDNKIELCMNSILKENLDAVYGNGGAFTSLDKGITPFSTDEVVSALAEGQHKVAELISSSDEIGCLLTQGAVYSRKVMDDLAWMRDKFILDDWPFTIKVWRDYKVGYVDEVVYLYRLHDDNIHKNYWRWFPARVQTVAELIEPDNKLDVLSFLMTSMSGASKGDSNFNDSYKFALAALVLADSDKNRNAALKLLGRLDNKVSSSKKDEINSVLKSMFLRKTLSYKLYIIVMRVILGLIPIKKKRKALKKKFNI